MKLRTMAGVAMLVVGLLGCGGGTATFYRGTMSTSQTYNGATGTSTSTGETVAVFTGGEQGALIVEASGLSFAVTRTGDNLTVQTQTATQTDSNSMSSTTITSGTGTLNAQGLSLTINGTQSQTSNGQTANATFMATFTGTKI